MPVGYLVATATVAVGTLLALAPRRPGRSIARRLGFAIGLAVNELPFVAFYWLLASTVLALAQGDVDSPVGWLGLALAVLATAGLVVVVRRALQTGRAVDDALREGLGSTWRAELDPGTAARLRRRLPWARILFAPLLFRRRDVERVANVRYGDAGKRTCSTSTALAPGPPAARRSSTCTAGRSQGPKEPPGAAPARAAREPGLGVHQRELPPQSGGGVPRSPDRRQEGDRLGARARPRVRRRSGDGVRGRELRRRLTSPRSPPSRRTTPRSSPASRTRTPRSPPPSRLVRLLRQPRRQRRVALVTGRVRPTPTRRRSSSRTAIATRWCLSRTPELRRRAARAPRRSPVVYAELPGAQHSFDLFGSVRFEEVVDAVEAFAAWVTRRS